MIGVLAQHAIELGVVCRSSERLWKTGLAESLGDDRVSVVAPAGVIVRFQTDSADTAQAIEDNQLRLRENLQRAGLSLLNFAVSQGEQPNAG